jgi:hypothetical protein
MTDWKNCGVHEYMLGTVAAFRSDRKADVLFQESGVFLAKAGAHRQASLPFSAKGTMLLRGAICPRHATGKETH